jgi:hypothetical protein
LSFAFRGALVSLVPADPAIVYFISRATHDITISLHSLKLDGLLILKKSVTKDIRSAEIV